MFQPGIPYGKNSNTVGSITIIITGLIFRLLFILILMLLPALFPASFREHHLIELSRCQGSISFGNQMETFQKAKETF